MIQQHDLLDEHEINLEPINGFNFIPFAIFGAVFLSGWALKFFSSEIGSAVAAIGFGAVSGYIWANVFFKSKRNTLVIILTVLTGLWFLYKGVSMVFIAYLLQSTGLGGVELDTGEMGNYILYAIMTPVLYYAGFFVTLAAFVISYNRELKLRAKTQSSQQAEEFASIEEL